MKTAFVAGLVLLASAWVQAGPRILVQSTYSDNVDPRRAEAIASAFENAVAEQIMKEFPCTSTATAHDMQALLGHLRERDLLATTDDLRQSADQAFDNFAGSFGADYLVALNVIASGSQCSLGAKWLDVRKAKALASFIDSGNPDGPGVLSAIDRLAEKLVDEAAYFEICPYTGPVKIKIHSTRAKDDRLEYPVFCNERDQQYVKTTSLSTMADTELDAMRTAKNQATGTVRYKSLESQKLVEEDPCHVCDSGRKGGWTYTEEQRATVAIEGLSQESSTAGQRFDDLRIYLKFGKDGTYRVELMAASRSGTRTVHVERKAEGTCDTKLEKPKEDYTVRVDIPLGNVMGPFPGTPQDKVLTGHQEFRQKDPISEEETTVNVEFQLHRD